MNEDAIYRKLVNTKIDSIQLDPYGYCDNNCWYCPRKYMPNMRIYRKHMPIDLLRHILQQFVGAKGTLVVDHFKHFWTGHYNEILLYRHFGEFLALLENLGLCTTVLSNGLHFTDRNIAMVKEGMDNGTVVGMCLNIPAGDPESFLRYTGNGPDKFSRMVSGVSKMLDAIPDNLIKHGCVSIVVNGVDDATPDQRTLLGPNIPYIPGFDLDKQERQIKALFPKARVYKAGGLFDRGGHLTKHGVFNHTRLFARPDQFVVACSNCGDIGGRSFAWAHINSLGELFLCCCDYSFEYCFGSMATESLTDLWLSKDHVKMIMKAHDGICRTCCSAITQARV